MRANLLIRCCFTIGRITDNEVIEILIFDPDKSPSGKEKRILMNHTSLWINHIAN